MKLVATWYREGRGFALGVVVGALTLGKASPYLVNALGSPSWRVNVGLASLIAAAGGLCGVLFGGPPTLLLIVAAIWGATVVADSAQFSACVTELGDPRYIGTALTMQTCIGFLITTASIRMMPSLVARVGWRYAFAALAVGPLLGIIAMLRLRGIPEAVKIAQGRR